MWSEDGREERLWSEGREGGRGEGGVGWEGEEMLVGGTSPENDCILVISCVCVQ